MEEQREGLLLLVVAADGRISSVDGDPGPLLGSPASDVVGTDLASWFHESARRAVETLLSTLDEPRRIAATTTQRARGAEGVTTLLTATAVVEPTGGPRSFVVQIERPARVVGTRDAHAVLHAMHDDLTGLPGRGLLMDRLHTAAARARRTGTRFACIFIDVDGLKQVNDNHGHAVGDELLIEVARRLRGRVRSTDTVGRFGGDEFVVILEELGEDAARAEHELALVTSVMIDDLATPLRIEGEPLPITSSAGGAISDGSETAEQTLQAADVAMYEAKRAGGNQFVLHDGRMRTLAQSRQLVRRLLDAALAAGGLQTYVQPVVRLDSGDVIGREALARIHDSEGGLTLAQDFIPIAEATDLIHEVGRCVLSQALARAKTATEWTAVNVSRRQLAEERFHDLVFELLDEHGGAASTLVLDITDAAGIVAEEPNTLRNIRRLHSAGVRFALDDLSRGRASLDSMRHVPLAFLKLGRDLVHGVDRIGSGDVTVIRAALGMAASMDMPVIAVGVESEIQERILRDLGVVHAQGFRYGRPVALAA